MPLNLYPYCVDSFQLQQDFKILRLSNSLWLCIDDEPFLLDPAMITGITSYSADASDVQPLYVQLEGPSVTLRFYCMQCTVAAARAALTRAKDTLMQWLSANQQQLQYKRNDISQTSAVHMDNIQQFVANFQSGQAEFIQQARSITSRCSSTQDASPKELLHPFASSYAKLTLPVATKQSMAQIVAEHSTALESALAERIQRAAVSRVQQDVTAVNSMEALIQQANRCYDLQLAVEFAGVYGGPSR